MTDSTRTITDILEKQIAQFAPEVTAHEVGFVIEAGDGIARVRGLAHVRSQELVQFANGDARHRLQPRSRANRGDHHGRVQPASSEGMEVRATGRIASVPVGEALIGRVVNALGEPMDGKGPIAREPLPPDRAHRSAA